MRNPKNALSLAALLVVSGLIFTIAFAQEGDLTIWGWKSATDEIIESGSLERFSEAYPDIDVTFVDYSAPDLYQQLPLAITAGVGAPDVAIVESSNLAQFVDFGGLADLTDLVAPYRDDINTFKWAQADLGGKTYAMPWDSGPVVLYYRRDVLEAAGLSTNPDDVSEMAATWDGYLEMCQTIKDETGNDCFPQNKANNRARFYEMMLWQQGLGYFEGDEITVDSPENIATLETLGKFWEADLLSDQLEWTDGFYSDLSSTEDPVATIVAAAWLGGFLEGWIAPDLVGKWGVALMPSLNAESPRSANDGGSNLVILEQSEHKEAARAFVEFMLGDRQSQIDIFTASNFWPSLETTYDAEIFAEANPYFADQQVNEIYVDVARQVPEANIYGPNYSLINGYVATAIQKYALGQTTAEAALKEAAETIRRDLQ